MFDFYEKGYYYEFERKDRLSDSVNLPSTIIIAISGAIFYCISEYIKGPISCNFASFAFFTLIIFSMILIISSSFYLFEAFKSVEYCHIPDNGALTKHYEDILKFYKNNDGDFFMAEDLADKYFRNYLARTFSNAAAINDKTNANRSLLLHKGKRFLLSSVLVVFTCAALLLFRGVEHENGVTSSSVSKCEFSAQNTKEKPMADGDKDSEKEQEKAPPPQLPDDPPLRMIKEERKKPD